MSSENVVSPIASPRLVNVDNATWEDIHEDDGGEAAGIFGIAWGCYSSKQLRTICSKLSVRGVKNAKKADMANKIKDFYKNKKLYNQLQYKDCAPRREVQYPFCLINVLFSDEFAEKFATIGNMADRQTLDRGAAANDKEFWKEVQDAFVHPWETDYGNLLVRDGDEIMEANRHIDPGVIVEHDWKKLRSMWKQTNADYKAALTRFTLSGTHDDNFYNFCNGKLDAYYLRQYLQVRPELNGMVEADLPEDAQVTSENLGSSSDNSSSESIEKPVRKRKTDQVAEAIREFGNSKMKIELSKQKLHFLELEEVRRDKEEERWDKEEDRRQKEEERRQWEHKQTNHEKLFAEWQKVRVSLKEVRSELRHNELDVESKEDLNMDLKNLKQLKKELEQKLGFGQEGEE